MNDATITSIVLYVRLLLPSHSVVALGLCQVLLPPLLRHDPLVS